MGCVGSDAEDELRTSLRMSKRFKFAKKCSDDGVAVDYAAVPRKLRSDPRICGSGSLYTEYDLFFKTHVQEPCVLINKKRCRDYVSLHFLGNKKLNHTTNGLELSRKDGLKKFKKHGVSDGSGRHVVIGAITKDEEEVAEALYALAAMFPETTKMDKTGAEGEPSETEHSAFLRVENLRPAVEDIAATTEEAGTMMICTDNAEAANHSSDVAASAREVLRSNADENVIEKLSCDAVVSSALAGANKGQGSKIPQSDLSLTSEKMERVLGSAACIRGQHELLCTVRENRSDGSQLWSGLSSTKIRDSDTQRPLSWSSTSKLEDTNCSLQPPALEKSVITKMGAQVNVDSKKSRKRCPTHVYISCLIKNLQITETDKTLQMQCTQSTTNEGRNQGARITSNNSNESTSVVYGIVSTDSAVCSAAERNSAEVRDAILLHKRLLQDQQQASTTSRLYALQKQNIDFLSLDAGGARGEIGNGTAKSYHGLGTTTQLDIPHLQSKTPPVIPFLLPQNCYTSNPLINHPRAAAEQQVQLRPYLGSTRYGALITGVTESSKQQQPWQHQRQQNWTDQLTAHCKPGRVASSSVPNWQNGGQASPSLLQYAPSIFPTPHSSSEMLGPNYAPTSRQQQQLIAVSQPLPPPRGQGQHHHLSYSYEGKGGSRVPESVPPLQLLCNEHF